MNKVSYTFERQDQGNIVFRSKVTSFNLDNVTDKDILSFYHAFSSYVAFDTGILPLDGTGLLCIRKAGNHTQIAYQHKPGSYYVNWGESEGDVYAKKYLLAQPYRIVIADLIDNQFYGARTFYSVVPVTHPDIQMYHVNLPNINCKGYRGNAVGWVCLYHRDDISHMPFSEQLSYVIDRCSGSEAYNDSNMSETDGPRFYHQKYERNEEYRYLWDPQAWEHKTLTENHDWTLGCPIVWIPVMVRSLDSQSEHFDGPDAVPLTFGMALTGNYAAYYHDHYQPKPINLIVRDDYNASAQHINDLSQKVTNWFILSYNNSKTTFSGLDPMSDSMELRQGNVDKFYEVDGQDHEDKEQDEPEEEELPFKD
jgi:hypothetical protein